jgi:hypothetical protein
MSDGGGIRRIVITEQESAVFDPLCHCEERSDEAISMDVRTWMGIA